MNKIDYNIYCENGNIPEIIKTIFPSSLSEWLYKENVKCYNCVSYKFGEKLLSEEQLYKMLVEKKLYAFYHYLEIKNTNESYLDSLYDNLELNVCVVERVPNSLIVHLKQRYLNMRPCVRIKNAIFVTLKTPTLFMKIADSSCPFCEQTVYSISDYNFCTNLDCKFSLSIEKLNLSHFDFDTGVVLKQDKISEIVMKNFKCPKCDSCKNCKKTLKKHKRRCRLHPMCTHQNKSTTNGMGG